MGIKVVTYVQPVCMYVHMYSATERGKAWYLER